MSKSIIFVWIMGLVVAPAFGQPREWSDDFLTVTTYDSASVLAPCSGGPPTKYTLIEALVSDIFNERALSGNGKFIFTNRAGVVTSPPLPARVEVAVVGWFGLGTGCPGEPPVLTTSEPFTSNDVCIYGGILFNPWHLRHWGGQPVWYRNEGPDAAWGVANIDDDLDGTTDEMDEGLPTRPTTVGGGYGNRDGTGFQAGVDAAPGDANVDDDGNGTTDDLGENGWPGTDDGDDRNGHTWWMNLRADFLRFEAIYINIHFPWSSSGWFALKESINLGDVLVEDNNEIGAGFYQPHTHYNYVFCGSGTCYGAMLWTENDMANPNETIGPRINSSHNSPTANEVAFGYVKDGNIEEYLRRLTFSVNTNFSHTFWVCSGPPTMTDFANGIFGYPSPSSDLDGDRDVDVNDFLTFSGCFAGSLVPPAPGCQNTDADLDGDADVDVNDFLTFSGCFNGSLQRPNAACFPPVLTNCGS